jgi:hypothetical protein
MIQRCSVQVGDLVRLKHQGNGHPSIGIVKSVRARSLKERVYICAWNKKPLWDFVEYNEGELDVISESR